MRVTATGGGFSVTVAEAKGAISGVIEAELAAFLVTLILALGRVRVTLALASLRVRLVLARAIPGAATASVPLPDSTTTTSTPPRVVVWEPALDEDTVAEPVMVVPLVSPVVSTNRLRVSEAPSANVPMEQVTLPEPSVEHEVPEARHAGQVVGQGVAPVGHPDGGRQPVDRGGRGVGDGGAHPPSVPALTWFWSGGVEEGTWKVGVDGGGLTVVEPRAATPEGGVHARDSVVGVPWITKVTSASMAPGMK